MQGLIEILDRIEAKLASADANIEASAKNFGMACELVKEVK